ncbi:secreted frizzled-related protein 5 isoform X2 [Strongylocentrotus purpuratus]|uniref:Secreted frizzled-related protein 1 n=1 Tax=Strongylocentrotus purpuratus TaxID=7668 RepID=A0A7M7RCW3_STRPU|nr:secreted frizzled-related protein 5 isoform X2 [Strongylocentrotus purpuratus]|eukprot:XP_781087.2 PREDICTED: secreted frizzled-related protein 5 isoform X2 [Strongylocentrotus purpuratus]
MIERVLVVLLAFAASSPGVWGQETETDMAMLGVNSRTYPLDLSGRPKETDCVDIPEDLSLCQNIGYTRMRMPNLLEHDSLDEVRNQAKSWVPLLLQRCHEGTQLFLCTLFAPVCLEVDRPIYPCRSLCEEVQAGCGPLMESNCFPWPAMLQCDKFPEDNDLCIRLNMRNQNGTVEAQPFEMSAAMQEAYMMHFTQCHDDSLEDTLLRKFCNSDFVLKVKIKTIRESKDGKKYIGDPNPEKLEVLKQGSLKTKDLQRLTFYVREGANCQCDMLERSGNYLLVMGHRDSKKNRKLFMTFVHSWEKTRDFRRAIKGFENPDMCENLETATEGRREEIAPQDAEPHEMTPADEVLLASQTNTPVNDGVYTTHQVMADETPSPKTNTRRERKRGKRTRDRPRKNRERENREMPVRRARSKWD